MEFSCLRYSKTDGVATIVKDNPTGLPTSRGGMTAGVLEEMPVAFADAVADPEVLAIVLTTPDNVVHHGGIVGGDLFPDGIFNAIEYMQIIEAGQRLCQLTETIEKPVIGVVKTGALGGGLEHLLSCDFVIAADEATFTFPEVTYGMAVGWGAAWRLPRAIGWMRAKELTLLAETVDGREAARLGIVTKAVPAEEVDAAVDAIVARLRSCSPAGIAFTKVGMAKSWSAPQHGGMGGDWEPSALAASSNDFNEALAAMREQRLPRFRPMRRLLRR